MSYTISVLTCPLAQQNFHIDVVKLYQTYYVKATYDVKPDANFVDADPLELAARMCVVYCVNTEEPRLIFRTSINSEKLPKNLPIYDCYCKRIYYLAQRRMEYSFPLAKGVILQGSYMRAQGTCPVENKILICLIFILILIFWEGK